MQKKRKNDNEVAALSKKTRVTSEEIEMIDGMPIYSASEKRSYNKDEDNDDDNNNNAKNVDLNETSIQPSRSISGKVEVKVVKGTGEIFDAEKHKDLESEIIPESKRRRRIASKRPVKVAKGTAEIFDPEKHQNKESQTITQNALWHRMSGQREVIVVKGTSEIFDPEKHQSKESEIITETKRRNRKTLNKTVMVVKGKAEIFDPLKHKNQESEAITQKEYNHRRNKITVVKGTTQRFRPHLHKNQKSETITTATFKNRGGNIRENNNLFSFLTNWKKKDGSIRGEKRSLEKVGTDSNGKDLVRFSVIQPETLPSKSIEVEDNIWLKKMPFYQNAKI